MALSYEKVPDPWFRRLEEFISAKLTMLIPYTTELEVTVANQKKIISQVAEKIEEMDKTIETENIQEILKSLDNENLNED